MLSLNVLRFIAFKFINLLNLKMSLPCDPDYEICPVEPVDPTPVVPDPT